MLRWKKLSVLALAAAVAGMCFMVGCGGDDDTDSDLVGTWISESGGSLESYEFSSSGNMCWKNYGKVGDAWEEGSVLCGPSSVSGGKISMGMFGSAPYRISGNTLTVERSDGSVVTYTRGNLADYKIVRENEALRFTDWTMTDDQGESWSLSFIWLGTFNGGRNYLTGGSGNGWYTIGDEMALYNEEETDCETTYFDGGSFTQCSGTKLTEIVKFKFTLTGSKGSRTLTLINTERGIHDVWTEQ